MKYIDADLLRAVIKEHILFYAGQANLLDDTNALDGYDEVLAILDSLQQEQPDVDLEKEIKSWILNECGPSDFNPFADHWCADDIMATARHFYELGKNSLK